MKRMTRVGLITSGGDCQGLNAAIRGVGKALLQSIDNVEIFGMRDGYRGLIECDYDFMGPGAFSGILTEGGTILGTSRQPYIPGKAIVDENGESVMPAMMDTYNRLNLDCLVVMGGNGTQKSAKLLMDAGMNVITLPKTIDNDLVGTDHTPGFGSAAKYIAVTTQEIIRDCAVYQVPAVTIIEIMGRDAGWLTASAALTGEITDVRPDYIYLPEKTFDEDAFVADVKAALEKFADTLDMADDSNGWFEKIKAIAESLGFATDMKQYKATPEAFKGSVADISMFVRVAITGKTNAPDLYTVIQIIGYDRIVARVREFANNL